ncbi:hypothetical protein C3747_70g195 [Trypanosoma cruzi]|uniref:Uncharacterized protein n=2 Tax=Trypanosoma cruzi TaxID=5693 RepID=Q4DI95_TRYCC|nr:hypothetical protein, conserved [Trypanosoma cruzi]EAN92242.1 hypothetical protein, conserved [Trypanosoma cruzi]PWV10278.1 hypothetical protein C3747_70g195 [Trypanosoma cruzi]RNC61185.1 hypothetical protein TcCL_ESM01197 [Trypanosoma cruzi]|eukprot:XP_814093.1 hypothetical protein [Trypanosoma cruzi strain CL Brener]
MAPRKKNAPKKELTAEDMRRLGMSEEDITRILAERGKSAEERRQEQEAAEARRRETEQRQKRMKELEKQKEELVRLEGGPRVAIRDEEDTEWEQLEETLTVEKKRRLRECAEKMVQQRFAEARRKREAEAAAYQETLGHLTPEEREAFVAAQIAAEHARSEAEMQAKEQQQKREERRLARERAARRAQRQRRRQDGEEDVDEEDADDIATFGGGAKASYERIKSIDELSADLHDKYD